MSEINSLSAPPPPSVNLLLLKLFKKKVCVSHTSRSENKLSIVSSVLCGLWGSNSDESWQQVSLPAKAFL